MKLVSTLGESRKVMRKAPAQETRVRVPPGLASVYPTVGGDSMEAPSGLLLLSLVISLQEVKQKGGLTWKERNLLDHMAKP